MEIFLPALLGAMTAAVAYAQQKLYPHKGNVPLGWVMLGAVSALGWWLMLPAGSGYRLPEVLTGIGSTIASLPTAITEAVATVWDGAFLIIGLVLAVFTVRQHVWVWPAGAVLAAGLGLQAWLEGDKDTLVLQLFFLVTQLYGWSYWNSYTSAMMKQTEGSQAYTSIRAPHLRLKHVSSYDLMFATIVMLGLSYVYIQVTTGLAEPGAAEIGLMTGASVVAQLLNARKHWAGWGGWVFTNLVALAYYAPQGDMGNTLMALLFLGVSSWGLITWYRLAQDQRAAGLTSELSGA